MSFVVWFSQATLSGHSKSASGEPGGPAGAISWQRSAWPGLIIPTEHELPGSGLFWDTGSASIEGGFEPEGAQAGFMILPHDPPRVYGS